MKAPSWTPAHPELRASLRSAYSPELRLALVEGALDELLHEVHPGVFRVQLFDPAACARLSADLDRYERWSAGAGARPNSMNRYGASLAELGYQEAQRGLLTEVVRPLAARAFPELSQELTSAYGFTVAYGPTQDRALGFHVDDSDLTLNLCLGDTFSGGELYFRGCRCARHREDDFSPSEAFEWSHAPGVALLHRGGHRHGVHPIGAGVRRNLILWCGTPERRRDDASLPCPSWCAH